MRRQVYIFVFLLILLSFTVYRYVMPLLAPSNSPAEQAVFTPPPPPLSTAALLADGSFNPLPPVKAKPADNPTSIVLANPWRARYRPFLDQVRPSPTSPGFYVYSFLDRTREGVGTNFTYGWHLVGSAALAAWSNARLAGANPPEHYGLPAVSEDTTAPLKAPTLDEWMMRALSDPATVEARYVIGGAYDFSPHTNQYSLKICLADRQNPVQGSAKILYEAQSTERGDYNKLSEEQRRAARSVIDALIAQGIIQARHAPAGQMPPLQEELGRVACMLDSNDSWTIMDGIDQALALQALYPDETAPLQAAAYGLNLLMYVYFNYAWETVYGTDYAMRSRALTQVALAKNPAASLSQLNWVLANSHAGVHPSRINSTVNGVDVVGSAPPELELYRRMVLRQIFGDLRKEQVERNPDWLVLWLEKAQHDFDWNVHPGRAYLQERIGNWTGHDLYAHATVSYNLGAYDKSRNAGFYRYARSSVMMMQVTIATELTTMLAAQSDAMNRDQVCNKIAGLIGGAEGLRDAVRENNYYAVRECLLGALANWNTPPAKADHPCFKTLAWMERQANAIENEPRWTAPMTGFTGFEFTRAERVRFARRQDHLGPMLMANHEEKQFGSIDGANAIGKAYLEARPTSAAGYLDAADCLERHLEDNDLTAFQRKAGLLNALHQFALDSDALYLAGRVNFYLDDQAHGLNYIREYMHNLPFSVMKSRHLGELFGRYGYNALAVKYYTEALKDSPERYDMANARAWALCEMGHYNDPEIRKTFALPVQKLPGNSTFHRDYLTYLNGWAHDPKAAREAAANFRASHPDSTDALEWQISIERKDGNTSKALELLRSFRPDESKRDLRLAACYANLCRAYIGFNMLPDAEVYLNKARNIDSWMGTVIEASAEYEFARGNYDEAIREYQREIDRYGPAVYRTAAIANCYYKKGMTDKAIVMLEEPVFSMRRHTSAIYQIPKLMSFYAEKGEKEKSRQAMDMLLHSSLRNRQRIWDTLESYRKIYPKEADEIWKNIDEIMAGPRSIN